jgi:hypothetical protein
VLLDPGLSRLIGLPSIDFTTPIGHRVYIVWPVSMVMSLLGRLAVSL